MLVERDVLARPLLYLSVFFKRHRSEYYVWLSRVREHGDYEGWLKFFLRGVREVSLEATNTARKILDMRDEHLRFVQSRSASRYAASLVEVLMAGPALTVRSAAEQLDVSYQTANKLTGEFEALGLLREITGGGRNRVFLYQPCINILGGHLEP